MIIITKGCIDCIFCQHSYTQYTEDDIYWCDLIHEIEDKRTRGLNTIKFSKLNIPATLKKN